MFAPEISDHNTLAILGLVQPWGSIMPISEIQSRLFYDAFAGGTTIPKHQEMLKLIDSQRMVVQKRYVQSPRHTIQVDYGVYMDDIAEILRCKPNVLKIMFTDPVLAWNLWNGPATAYTYRLTGPKPWKGARKAVLETKDRIFAGMAPDGKYIIQQSKQGFNYFYLFAITLLIALIIGLFTNRLQFHDLAKHVTRFI